MKQYPPVPRVDAAGPELFESGHLWIQELVDGAHVRFQLRESGVLRFGDRTRTYDPDEIPMPYRHAVRHVRERLDREALRGSVDDVESVVFFGEATHRHAIDYDWDRTPSFLGFDVWSAASGRFLPPDAVEQIYSRLGLEPVNTFAKEVRAVDFDPDSYDLPRSRWYDGPTAGVIVRNKTGRQAKLPHPRFRDAEEAAPVDAAPEELAQRYVTRRRIDAVADDLKERGLAATFDNVYERVLEGVAREEHHRLFHPSASVDMQAFRSEAAAQTRRLLGERQP